MNDVLRLVRRCPAISLAAVVCALVVVLACSDADEQQLAEPQSQSETQEPSATLRPTRTASGGSYLVVGPGEQFETIGAAIERANAGSTVIVHAGVYAEQVELPAGVTLEAYGDGGAIIDGECERNNGVWIPVGSSSVVRGMEIRNTTGAGVNIGNGPDGAPRPDNVLVERNRITDFNCNEEDVQFNAGVAAWYTNCCITVRDNEIVYRAEGDSHGKGDGIWFKSNSERPSGGGHTITGNVIVGGWDGIGGENEDDPHGTFDGNTLVEGNWIRDCWDDGIQVEGGDENVRVVANDISGCGAGIALAPVITGPLYVERNTIHDLVTGLYENRFCFKIGNEGGGTAYLTENVCATEGDGIAQTNSGSYPIVLRGNCIRVTRYVMEIADGDSVDMQGDRLWTTDPDRFIEIGGQKYGSLRELQSATGQETGALQTPTCGLPHDVDD